MASIRKRGDRPKPWEARYFDPTGRERSRSFARKVDAARFLATVEADIVRGAYVDPSAGRVTFAEFAADWLGAQTFDESTREAVASRLRVHVLPTLGGVELGAIRPSTVQAWVRGCQARSAPRSVRVMLANVSAILSAAVADGLIARNPCASPAVKAPAVEPSRIVPWTGERVKGVIAAHPAAYGAVPICGAGCGLRQGELFGLAVDGVDFLRRRIVVAQQVKLLHGRPILAPPKGRRTREVPLPDVVADALAERMRLYPPVEVVLPWRTLDGKPRASRLIFTSRQRGPLDRSHYNPYVWKPALRAVGVEATRVNGMHALRHHYASMLLEGGVSIRALADYLGHADPGFTLRTYTHLMPDSEDRTRAVVEAALGPRMGQGWAKTGDSQ